MDFICTNQIIKVEKDYKNGGMRSSLGSHAGNVDTNPAGITIKSGRR
jgi:hypothetical protein